MLITGQPEETVFLPAALHEAGHIVAAHHFGARVFGIGEAIINSFVAVDWNGQDRSDRGLLGR
jgi:hypothetical protein